MGQASGPSLSFWHPPYPLPPGIPTPSQRPHPKAWRLQGPDICCGCLAQWGLAEEVAGGSRGPATEGWGPRGAWEGESGASGAWEGESGGFWVLGGRATGFGGHTERVSSFPLGEQVQDRPPPRSPCQHPGFPKTPLSADGLLPSQLRGPPCPEEPGPENKTTCREGSSRCREGSSRCRKGAHPNPRSAPTPDLMWDQIRA